MRPKTSGSPKKQIQPNLYKVELLTDSATLTISDFVDKYFHDMLLL